MLGSGIRGRTRYSGVRHRRTGHLRLRPHICIRLVGLTGTLISGHPEAREHHAIRWVDPDGATTAMVTGRHPYWASWKSSALAASEPIKLRLARRNPVKRSSSVLDKSMKNTLASSPASDCHGPNRGTCHRHSAVTYARMKTSSVSIWIFSDMGPFGPTPPTLGQTRR